MKKIHHLHNTLLRVL